MHEILMHIDKNRRPNFRSIRTFAVAITMFSLLPSQVWAAVQGVGDVTPQQIFTDIPFGFGDDQQLVDITAPDLPFSGGRLQVGDGMDGMMDADLVVGGTGVFSGTTLENGTQIGTTIGSVTINSPTNTLPLIAENVFIGMRSNGRGRITLTDFGTTLIAEDELIVGEEGEGELRLTNGARVGVGIFNPALTTLAYEDGETIIGQMRSTSGANQFLSEGIVSIDGFGTVFETEDLTVADEGLGTIEISGNGKLLTVNTTLGNMAGSVGRVTLTGLNTRWTNTEDIVVGNNGSGILEVNDLAVVSADNITIGTTGFVNLAGGTLISNNSIVNNGVISGSGSFESPVTNNGDIIARDAIMNFNGGLNNTAGGSLVLGGDTTIFGNVFGGGIHVLAGSEATLVGDLALTGSILALTVGPAAGTLDVIGGITLSGAELDLEYSAGVFANAGDTYEILDSTMGIAGIFTNTGDQVSDDNGQIWDIIYNASSVWVTATGSTVPAIAGDFDGDGDVDGADFLSWQRGGSPTSGDLDDWEMNYGMGSIAVSATSAVPEPSTLAIVFVALACCPRRRKDR